VGRKALAVVERYPERFELVALAAGSVSDALAAQIVRHRPSRVAVAAGDAAGFQARLPAGTSVSSGPDAVAALAALPKVDLVVNGIVGRAGLESSLAAAASGKILGLANKETLVLAGELLMATARRGGATVLPIDSEHSGLFQALDGRPPDHVRRLRITASGGPFRGRSAGDLVSVKPQEALQHPIWPMGPRITVDSATLFNKGLEVIETHHLFDMPLDRIGVWVHPQSVVHALVELVDGSVIAQLAAPDMMIPVQFAMSHPERWDCEAPGCSLPDWPQLTFEEPDMEAFPALPLVFRAGEMGGTTLAALNAADEVAVAAFLDGQLGFTGIPRVLRAVLDAWTPAPADTLQAVVDADRRGREMAVKAVLAGD
jgi:1-deoxy-D-xylulose-5-phosphate reductoisomerase